MVNKNHWDFSGWATKNDLKCGDGRIIRRGAFKVQDGTVVPLVWNHQHNSPENILGHALLENRDEGVYAYCEFNNTSRAKEAKECVLHGDITALSILANNLQQVGPDVLHGSIREVSLVPAGSNPGAFIESVLKHSMPIDESDDEGIFYTGDSINILSHAAPTSSKSKKSMADEEDQEVEDSEEETTENEEDGDGETVRDVYQTLNPKQKKAVAIIVGQAIEDAKKGTTSKKEEEEGKEMRHSIFTNNGEEEIRTLSHSDIQKIFSDAKRIGSLREALHENLEEGMLIHSIDTTGMITSDKTSTYGINDPSMLFPEYKTLSTQPEWISRNMDWVQKVMSDVQHSPFSRIKSVYADITEDEARAKGYIKGKMKKEEVFTVLKRTTSPQSVYKKQKMDRDDILDITDFDVVLWIRAEMRVMLNEEIARAILIGDGRPADSDDKIQEIHVRPVAKDVPLFNTTIIVSVSPAAKAEEVSKEVINAIIRGRKHYKGSGNPKLWTTEDVLTDMLLIEDSIGHKLYKTEQELVTTLRVKEIVPVEPMSGTKITIDSKEYELLGVIVNLADYRVGADKGGEINNFEDFDIDYNAYKYLIETRISGALVKPFSALTILLDRTAGVNRMMTPSTKSE